MAEQRNVQKADIPNPLLAKVKAGPESGFDFAAADNVILELAKEFEARLPEELEKIEAAYKAVKETPEDEELRNALFRLVHDLKGQAGTFDYNLITVVGNDLCRFL
jgi:HPt (histidine-containing phosphotransfer) domain-containing protein